MTYCSYYNQYIDPSIEYSVCLKCMAVQETLVCKYKRK